MLFSLFLYERACENGEQEGCARIRILHELGIAVPQDFTKAFGLYESTCQQQTATGCYELGEIYELGQSVVPNQVLAETLYKQSCDLDLPKGCLAYGNIVMLEQSERPKRPEIAFEAYSMACQRQNLQSFVEKKAKCLKRDWVLKRIIPKHEIYINLLVTTVCTMPAWIKGEMYRQGRGLPDGLDTEKSLPIFVERILSRGSMASCVNAGMMYEKGEGSQSDYAQFPDIMHRPVKTDLLWDVGMARLYRQGRGVLRIPQRSVELNEQACDEGVFESCRQLGEMLEVGEGDERDRIRAMSLFRTACDGGNFCTQLHDFMKGKRIMNGQHPYISVPVKVRKRMLVKDLATYTNLEKDEAETHKP